MGFHGIGFFNKLPVKKLRTRLAPDFTVGGNIQSSLADSWYHGLEVELTKRRSKGLRLKLAFTVAKSIDTASQTIGSRATNDSGGAPLDPRDIGREKALSARRKQVPTLAAGIVSSAWKTTEKVLVLFTAR